METVTRVSLRRVALVIAAVALALVAALVLFGGNQPAAAEDAPTAQSIMQDKRPVGAELAAALHLDLMAGFDHKCQYFVEVEASGAGYCLEGLSTTDTADLYVIAQALQGTILTPEEQASFKENAVRMDGTADISSDPGST
jgi:uncharacterized integral membrane protein